MDEFLIPYSNFKRLYEEYHKYGSLSLGVDFDNTIFDFHKKGYKYDKVISLLHRAMNFNFDIHIFTANPDHELVNSYCKDMEISIKGINTDGLKFAWSTRKPFYSLLLDDRAGLPSAVEDLEMLLSALENEQLKKEE